MAVLPCMVIGIISCHHHHPIFSYKNLSAYLMLIIFFSLFRFISHFACLLLTAEEEEEEGKKYPPYQLAMKLSSSSLI